MKNFEKAIKLMLIASIIIVATLLYFAAINLSKLKNINSQYSHTKAICNDNFCQDYEVYCKNKEVVKMTPITGAVARFPANWQDSRTPENQTKLCE